MKKDDYLQTMMLVPPKQKMSISRFDQRTQRDAFTVSLDGIKGVRELDGSRVNHTFQIDAARFSQWNVGQFITESPQAKEDRKKRVREVHVIRSLRPTHSTCEQKEAKKLAKAQALGGGIPATPSLATLPPNATGLTPIANVIVASSSSAPLSASTPGAAGAGRIPPTPASMSIGTPRPAPPTQRASSRPPGPGPGAGMGVLPATGPSHAARPGTPSLAGATTVTPRPRPSTPSIPNGSNGVGVAAMKRGTKREYEEDIPLAQVVANANAQKRAVAGGMVGQQNNMKNGVGVGPPRPLKKVRTVSRFSCWRKGAVNLSDVFFSHWSLMRLCTLRIRRLTAEWGCLF